MKKSKIITHSVYWLLMVVAMVNTVKFNIPYLTEGIIIVDALFMIFGIVMFAIINGIINGILLYSELLIKLPNKQFNNIIDITNTMLMTFKKLDGKRILTVQRFLWLVCLMIIGLSSKVVMCLVIANIVIDMVKYLFEVKTNKLELIPETYKKIGKNLQNEFSFSILKTNLKKLLKEKGYPHNIIKITNDIIFITVYESDKKVKTNSVVKLSKTDIPIINIAYNKGYLFKENFDFYAGTFHTSYTELFTNIKDEIKETINIVKNK